MTISKSNLQYNLRVPASHQYLYPKSLCTKQSFSTVNSHSTGLKWPCELSGPFSKKQCCISSTRNTFFTGTSDRLKQKIPFPAPSMHNTKTLNQLYINSLICFCFCSRKTIILHLEFYLKLPNPLSPTCSLFFSPFPAYSWQLRMPWSPTSAEMPK